MEDCKTKYIESSLAAFRAIKTFIFLKGIYPRNFNIGFWDEEDYNDPMRWRRFGYPPPLFSS